MVQALTHALPTGFGNFRPVTQSGRPLSGVLRPGSTASARPGTSLDQALKARATTARPISASAGRLVFWNSLISVIISE